MAGTYLSNDTANILRAKHTGRERAIRSIKNQFTKQVFWYANTTYTLHTQTKPPIDQSLINSQRRKTERKRPVIGTSYTAHHFLAKYQNVVTIPRTLSGWRGHDAHLTSYGGPGFVAMGYMPPCQIR